MNSINLTQSSLENANAVEGSNAITIENFIYNNEYRDMTINEKISFLYG